MAGVVIPVELSSNLCSASSLPERSETRSQAGAIEHRETRSERVGADLQDPWRHFAGGHLLRVGHGKQSDLACLGGHRQAIGSNGAWNTAGRWNLMMSGLGAVGQRIDFQRRALLDGNPFRPCTDEARPTRILFTCDVGNRLPILSGFSDNLCHQAAVFP